MRKLNNLAVGLLALGLAGCASDKTQQDVEPVTVVTTPEQNAVTVSPAPPVEEPEQLENTSEASLPSETPAQSVPESPTETPIAVSTPGGQVAETPVAETPRSPDPVIVDPAVQAPAEAAASPATVTSAGVASTEIKQAMSTIQADPAAVVDIPRLKSRVQESLQTVEQSVPADSPQKSVITDAYEETQGLLDAAAEEKTPEARAGMLRKAAAALDDAEQQLQQMQQ